MVIVLFWKKRKVKKMKCPKCRRNLPSKTKFCIYCGAAVKRRKIRYVLLISILIAIVGNVGYMIVRNANVSSQYSDDFYWTSADREDIQADEQTGIHYVDNQLIIRADRTATDSFIEELAKKYHCELIGYLDCTKMYQLKFKDHYRYNDLNGIAEKIKKEKFVNHVSIDTAIKLDIQYNKKAPNDKEWKSYWQDSNVNPEDLNWGMKAIHAREAWEYIDDMSEVNIGVFDNMFCTRHNDLRFEKAPLLNLSDERIKEENKKLKSISHGTHVSGTIAALFNNKQGVAGVAPKNKLYAVSESGIAENYTTISRYIVALTELIAIDKCKVVNISLGIDHLVAFAASRDSIKAKNEITEDSNCLAEYLEFLLDSGYDFIISTAAGNQNSTDSNTKYQYIRVDPGDPEDQNKYGYVELTDDNKDTFKAKYEDYDRRVEFGNVDAKYDVLNAIENKRIKDRIIVVGAAKCDAQNVYSIADFSQCGERVNILAPGVNIYSTGIYVNTLGFINKTYLNNQGTSMAAPHVAGVAAMVFSINPNLSGEEVKNIVCSTASGEYEWSEGKKYEMLNAENAVKKALDSKKSQQEEAKEDEENDNRNVSYPTDFDENTMQYQRMVAKDEACTYMKNLNGKLERKNNDGSAGDKVLYEEDFFTICGIDASYIYLLKASEEKGVYDLLRVSKDGKKKDSILKSINWCLHMDEEYFYYVPNDNNKSIRRLNRENLSVSDLCELHEPVEVMVEQDDNFMVVTKENSIFSFLGGAENDYYLINKDGGIVKEYGKQITVEEYPREYYKEGGYHAAVQYISNGYLRGTAQAVHLQYGGGFIKAEGISGWKYEKDGIITTVKNETEQENALPYQIVLYDAKSGNSKRMVEVNSNQAFFTMCQDGAGNWWYFDQTDTELILYSLSNDFTQKEEIKRFDLLRLSCDLENCGMEIMDNRIYFYSMPDSATANAIYRYDLILED